MGGIYFYADPHYGHDSCINKFKAPDGVSPLRPFSTVEEMNLQLKKRYKETIGNGDTVYWLGDITMDNQLLEEFLSDLPGRKYLIQGNHDTASAHIMLRYFRDILPSGFRRKEFILSHIPLYPANWAIRGKCNIHGHMHANKITKTVMTDNGIIEEDDPGYFCCSVEQTDYRPIHIDKIRKILKERKPEDDDNRTNLPEGSSGSN